MDDGVMLTACRISWIDRFHASIKTEEEVAEVQAHAKAVSDSHIAQDILESELSSRLALIVAYGPYITGIDESGAIEFPEEEGTIFKVEVEPDVARLVDEVDTSVCSLVRAWPEFPHAPSSHTVSSTREVSFLKRQHRRVAIGISHAKATVKEELRMR